MKNTYTQSAEEVLRNLGVGPVGLTTEQAQERLDIMKQNKAMADRALRVLAAAKRDWAEKPADNTPGFLEQELAFLVIPIVEVVKFFQRKAAKK